MRIETIISAYAPDAKRPSAVSRHDKSENASKTATHAKKDRVEISGEAQRRLDLIKNRIDRGYYQKSAVLEDISDKLSGVMESLDS